MVSIDEGDIVGIPCQVFEGPFSGELMVQFESRDGTISGFAREKDVQKGDSGRNFLAARVVKVQSDDLLVKVRGSFFTTNGLTRVRRSGIGPHAKEAA